MKISIRTPAWGVTTAAKDEACRMAISIRTPAWGVTFRLQLCDPCGLFQFAPPRGG